MKPGFESDSNTSVIEEVKQKNKTMPRWNVILFNTDTHTFQYVIELLCKIFNKTFDDAKKLAMQIHEEGQAIVDVTTKERAELKKEQVASFGADPHLSKSKGPIPCEIEPVE